MSAEMAELVFSECSELIDAATAKAYYGIIKNFVPLTKLAKTLQIKRFMTGKAMLSILEKNNFKT